MMNMLKNNLTVADIINFVHKALENNMDVATVEMFGKATEFHVQKSNDDKGVIYFQLYEDSISVRTYMGGFEKEYSYSDRELLDIAALKLEIKEYREAQATKLFNNFFTSNNTPASIDDLNDNDD